MTTPFGPLLPVDSEQAHITRLQNVASQREKLMQDPDVVYLGNPGALAKIRWMQYGREKIPVSATLPSSTPAGELLLYSL